MSLSKIIIYKNLNELLDFLKGNPEIELNEIDEYGYTPLIQAAIVNSKPKAELLLRAGANVNFTDLTGRTALHWAADNNNFELTKLLLQSGADPNAYSYAGQPVLVMPLLRKQNRLKKLLVEKSANIDFAEDFINAKLLGHSFELEGRIDIIDNKNTFIEVELEGFYLEFSIQILITSLLEFYKNFGGKYFREYFPHLEKIIAALQVGGELVKFQHYLTDIAANEKRINELLDSEPLVLPLAFDGHAITLIKYANMLIRCDRGEFGRENGTVIFYKMANPHGVDKNFCKELLYKRQPREFINQGMISYLGLEPKFTLPLSIQRAGNCSFANVEAIIPTLMFLFLLEEKGLEKFSLCEKEALEFYNEWKEWDKERSLFFCIDSFHEANPARKASKAALLATILFQACSYENNRDPHKAYRIISILTIKEYDYILKSYFKVFQKDKDNANLKSLSEFLDDYRMRYENL